MLDESSGTVVKSENDKVQTLKFQFKDFTKMKKQHEKEASDLKSLKSEWAHKNKNIGIEDFRAKIQEFNDNLLEVERFVDRITDMITDIKELPDNEDDAECDAVQEKMDVLKVDSQPILEAAKTYKKQCSK